MTTATRRRTRLGLVCLGIAVLLALLGQPAGAHSGKESYVYLTIEEGELTGRVEIPVADLNTVTGLEIPDGGAAMEDAIAENTDAIRAYVGEHLAFADETGEEQWTVTFDEELGQLDLSAGSYVLVPFEVTGDFETVPQKFTVTYDGVIDEVPDKTALLLIERDWEGGEFKNEADHLLRYTPENTTQVVDRDASFWTGFLAVIGLGTEHIRIGTDHILFVLALVIPAALVFTRGEGWRPTPTFGAGLWRVTKIATMFTVAHSITLTLGGLDILPLNPKPVEVFIALSIAAAAMHNIYPIFVNREWVLAFFFGLFHGLGFAGLLEELGLDGGNRVWSLLGFNLGIELGQLVIIFLVFPVLFLLRRTAVYPVILYGASVALAIAALGWSAERAFDLPERVNIIIEPVLAWPRAAWLVVIAGALAAVYNRWASANGKLRGLDEVLPGPAFQRRGGPPREEPPATTPDAPPPDELQPVG